MRTPWPHLDGSCPRVEDAGPLPTLGRLLLLVHARRGAGPLHRGATPIVAFAVAAALAAAAVGRLGAPSSAPKGRMRGCRSLKGLDG
jgi:hypothetical protein